MSSRHETPLDLSDDELDTREPSSAPLSSTLPSAFGRLMNASSASSSQPAKRDRCNRPTITYNEKYNPYKAPPEDLDARYSPYIYGEPLHDDRPIIVARIPSQHIAWNIQLGK
jgi:hypothetical protein